MYGRGKGHRGPGPRSVPGLVGDSFHRPGSVNRSRAKIRARVGHPAAHLEVRRLVREFRCSATRVTILVQVAPCPRPARSGQGPSSRCRSKVRTGSTIGVMWYEPQRLRGSSAGYFKRATWRSTGAHAEAGARSAVFSAGPRGGLRPMPVAGQEPPPRRAASAGTGTSWHSRTGTIRWVRAAVRPWTRPSGAVGATAADRPDRLSPARSLRGGGACGSSPGVSCRPGRTRRGGRPAGRSRDRPRAGPSAEPGSGSHRGDVFGQTHRHHHRALGRTEPAASAALTG
jgi:hypothetical protein